MVPNKCYREIQREIQTRPVEIHVAERKSNPLNEVRGQGGLVVKDVITCGRYAT
jgi:hypothetical protein